MDVKPAFCTYQLAIAVDETDCLGNVIQAHGYILLPAHQHVWWEVGDKHCKDYCRVGYLAGPVMSSVCSTSSSGVTGSVTR